MSALKTSESGVSLPRSQPPAIPANFISRDHLFSLFETQVPGSTLVIAPAGYGKTSLVSAWAQASERPTIWYTVDVNDTFEDFKAHLVDSIQKFIPEVKQVQNSAENVGRANSINSIVKIVAQYPGDVNFVIDFGRGTDEGVLPFRQLLVDATPENVHIVIVRRTSTDASLARYASHASLSLITSEDLKFSESEVEIIAGINQVNLQENGNARELKLCAGWPAAVQLMCRNIGKNNAHAKFADAISSHVNPIAVLALETYNAMTPENRSILLKLSIVEEFDNEVASIILGEEFSESYINRLVTDGLFITASSTKNRIYRFNPLVFEALAKIQKENKSGLQELHLKLVDLYVQRKDATKALEHAFSSGDSRRFYEVFRVSVREMAAIGRGDLLIKWSNYAGDASAEGQVRQKTIKIVGHLVNLDFGKAEAMAIELEHIADLQGGSEFLKRLCAMIRTHIYFARGDFAQSSERFNISIQPTSIETSLQELDLIALMRLRASQAFLHDDFDELVKIYEKAKILAQSSTLSITHYHLLCMQAMALYSYGQYFQAAEAASAAIEIAEQAGYKGITGPLDVMLVLARAQLEASDLEKAVESFSKIAYLAQSWEIWPWYFMAQGSITRIHISARKFVEGAEDIAKQKKFLRSMQSANSLGWIVDMSEAFLHLYLDEVNRANELIKRMPRLEMVVQIELSNAFAKDSKAAASLVSALPELTVRHRITKLLAITIMNSNHENLALKSLSEALELGADCGYHEYFIRQHKLYPLIVKVCAQRPTVYLEELVQSMTESMHARVTDSGILVDPLTKREIEILKHLTTGHPISSIAKSLHISQNTMKTHLRNTYRKLDADGRHSAVEKAKKLLLI